MAAITKLKKKIFSSSKHKSNKPPKGKDIDKKMKMDHAKQKQTIRILLLGPGDSGKTTILKQMKKIHNQHNDFDVNLITSYIQDAVVEYMKKLCTQSIRLHDEFDEKTLVHPDNEPLRKQFLQINSTTILNDDLCKKIKILWADDGIKQTLAKRHYFQIHDNVSYFLSRIDIISAADYTPSFDDYLRIRTRSTGFAQTNIVAEIENFGHHTFEFTDVGGQRSERKKWMRFISEDIDAVLYIIAISEYDMNLFEDNKTNRLVEAVELFKSIMLKGHFFTNKSVLLFFNKYDLFK